MTNTPFDNIEEVVKTVEKYEGHPIPGLRKSLEQAKVGEFARITKPEQILVRVARKELGLSQSKFAELINTPLRTLQEWEQGRSTPPGAAIKLCELILANPEILAA